MIIELPEQFCLKDPKLGKLAYVENGILKCSREVSFRRLMIEITYQLKGRYKCYYCNEEIPENEITIDHMYPSDFGGPTVPNNLVPSCKKCNNEKGNMTKEQYITYLSFKKKNEDERFLKSLKKHQEFLRENKKYQLPEGWITEKKITDIITNINLNEEYKVKKYRSFEKYYLKYGSLQKPIVVDRRSFLLDGFFQLMLAKNYYISTIPVIILENVEVIL